MFKEEKKSEGILMGELWKEMKEWRKHWQLGKFFKILFLGLAASLFDSATDFNFAWSVPAACGNRDECSVEENFDLSFVSTPCGRVNYKAVERLTYTFIAFPAFSLGFSTLQSLVVTLVNKCWRGKVNRIVEWSAATFAVAVELSLFVGLLSMARGKNGWTCALPHLAPVYNGFIQTVAYLSAIITIGIKCFGIFCHGPQSCHLVFRAKEAETKFEAAFQLSLLSSIYIGSGINSPASLLSGTSSIIIISTNGAQNFLQRHEEKLLEASILGKICVAASVLPIFILTTVFKLGAYATNRTWNEDMVDTLNSIGVGLPILIILLLKGCNLLKNLPTSNVFQFVMFDLLSLQLWPKGRDGKIIGLSMAVYTFLYIAVPGPFLISSPEPNNYRMKEWNNNEYDNWVARIGERLQSASISFLVIGFVAFVLVICMILFEDKWVAEVVSKFPHRPKEDDNEDPEKGRETNVEDELAATELSQEDEDNDQDQRNQHEHCGVDVIVESELKKQALLR